MAVSTDDDPLRAKARRLAPLIRNNRGYWAEGIIRWASNPPEYGDDGILPVPLRVKLTLDEKLALLAAIHDACVTSAARIHPWRDPDEMPQLADDALNIPGEYRLAIRYDILIKDRVPKLREHWETHEAAIEMFIAEVEKDLADVRPENCKPANVVDGLGQERRATSPSDEIQNLLAAFADAAVQFQTAPRVVAFKNAARDDGLTTIPR